ncbi:hypothetical protein NSQ89_10305 [Niallia sp. FSL R7-0648]|uniref:hypothetical protein n=1 Tax=Niallia sp. FSL R7-0648 TaxID=2954521 RepID=UPI0030F5F115
MNNKAINFVVLALIMSAVVVNNLEALYTFKMIFNGVVMAVLVLIGCERIYRYTKRNRKAI